MRRALRVDRRRTSMRVDEERKDREVFSRLKVEGKNRSGEEGEEPAMLLCDPGSELRLGRMYKVKNGEDITWDEGTKKTWGVHPNKRRGKKMSKTGVRRRQCHILRWLGQKYWCVAFHRGALAVSQSVARGSIYVC